MKASENMLRDAIEKRCRPTTSPLTSDTAVDKNYCPITIRSRKGDRCSLHNDSVYDEDDGLGYLQYCIRSFTKTSTYRFGILYTEKRCEEDDQFSCYDVDPGCISADVIVEEL